MNLQPKHLQCSALPDWASRASILETLGLEPKITKCKFVVLPVRLCPLAPCFHKKKIKTKNTGLSEKRLERLRYLSTKLKFVLSTNSSTRILVYTLNWTKNYYATNSRFTFKLYLPFFLLMRITLLWLVISINSFKNLSTFR